MALSPRVLVLAVFADLLGFGIVLPLLPRYARATGATGAEIGLVLAVYSAAQLLLAPLWGRLSDRAGRRPLLLLGLTGSTASYVLFAFADGSYALLLASRVVAGVCGATVATANAYLADVTPPAERGRRMALIGAAFGFGFTVGPVLGGAAADWWGRAAPGFAAACCSLTGLLVAWRAVAEPARHVARQGEAVRVRALRFAASTPAVALVLALMLAGTFAFSCMEGTLPLLTKEQWYYDLRENGLVFTWLGFWMLLAQGWLVRRFLPRVGEARMAAAGCALLAAGLLGVGAAPEKAAVFVALPVAVCGAASLSPSLTSLLSRASPAERQGEMLGVGQAVLALARILGHFLANVLFARAAGLPYWTAAAVMVVALAAALRLRRSAAA